MKNYHKFIIILLVISFLVPQVALASWWNPFSWNIWRRVRSVFIAPQVQEEPKQEQEQEVFEEELKTEETDLEIENKPSQELLPEQSQADIEKIIESERLRKQTEEQKRQDEIKRQIEESERLKMEAEKLAEDQKKQEEIVKQLELTEQEKPKNKYPEIKALIDFYWENPTIANFEEFCKRSKNVLSPETKKVLNKDRTEMIDVNKTLYETIMSCQIYLEKQLYYKFIKSGLTHKIEFRDSEIDEIRKFKIEYNQKIEEISERYNFFGYPLPYGFIIWATINSDNGPSGNLSACLNTYKKNRWGNYISDKCNASSFISGLIVPEEQLKQLQKQYE